jgi:hypothetical protein
MTASIERATAVTDEIVDAFRVLIPQLSSSNAPPGREQLEAIVSSPTCVLFLARMSSSIRVRAATGWERH